MQRVTRWKMVFSACLAAVLLTGSARAEDKKPAAKALDRHSLDESVYQNLRGIIDHGANLYNQGDWNGCYRLWEGALMSMKPLLDHRPKLQEAIDGGLTSARQDAMLWHRAWVLRPVLDKIRSDIDADYPHRKKSNEAKPDPNTPVVTPKPKPKPKAATLWGRLGGEAGVTKIVDDFVNTVTKDPKVDFFRHNKVKLDAEQIVQMKRGFVEQVSQLTGGPLKYTGPDMKKIHRDMGITNEQFDAAAADLKKALDKNKVGPDDKKKILGAVENYRKEIVQPKKPEDKKPIDKKPEDKKPVDKKPEDKKPIDKKPKEAKPATPKPVDKKPEDKKPQNQKPADTSSVSGKVIYKGKPVPAAIVTFVSAGGDIVAVPVGADGSYTANRLKPGAYKVTIAPPPAKPGAPKVVAIPAKYSNLATSPLACEVKKGKQAHDFDLR